MSDDPDQILRSLDVGNVTGRELVCQSLTYHKGDLVGRHVGSDGHDMGADKTGRAINRQSG